MRIVDAYFKGYAGFYHGMGLEELHIDLSKCKYNIVLIVGKNGCGKSTLESALNIFPDNNSMFRTHKDGEKRLKVLDGSDVYDIDIQYPVDNNGNRKTTKAFLSRNGVELNPNGNITSYKDLLSTEFELDPNFITLSMITSTDRGLGDKRPAERKKFVGSVIDNLATYNNIYKTLNKKSLIYKSHTNTIYTKIQSTGDKKVLDSNLSQLRVQEKNLNDRILEANNLIVAIKTKNSIDEEDVANIERLNTQKVSVESELESIKSTIGTYINKTKISQNDIESTVKNNEKLLETYKTTYEKNLTEWKEKTDRLSQIESTIRQLEVTVSEAYSNIDNQLEDKYKESTTKLESLVSELNKLGFTPGATSTSELIDIIDFYKDFIRKLDVFYDGLDTNQVRWISIDYNPQVVPDLQKDSEVVIGLIEETKNEITKIESDIKTLSILDNRPKNCKIGTCPFISDAVNISKITSKKKLIDQLEELQQKILDYSNNLTKIQENITNYNNMIPKRMEFQIISNLVENIRQKYPKSIYLSKAFNNFEENVSKFYSFNEARNPEQLILGLNLLSELEEEQKINSVISASYKSHRETIKIINSTNSTLESMRKEQEELNIGIIDIKNKVDKSKSLIDSLSSNINDQYAYLEVYNQQKEIQSKLDDINKELEVYQKKSSKAVESMNEIQKYQNIIDHCNESLQPVRSSINDISGRLTLLNSYYQEYETYNESYKLIETLKKYCSPTGGGIQTIFMQLYMSKTLELSNQILGMLFGGDYQLIDFIINENEFRIPFIGNNLQVDDISSGSNSQICMMGMVINLVLLHQASTKYNIAYLDEIDAGLDHRNRFEFVDALYRSIPLLNIEQLFMISHSMETDTSSVDIIKLKGYEDFEDTIQAGNIIFDYSKLG